MAPVTVGVSVDIYEKTYRSHASASPVPALRNLRACVAPSEFCVITGPSGCGKTTLLNIIAGLDRDFTGALNFKPSDGGPPRIGYVFQSPRLLPWRTVRENIALVLARNSNPAELEGLLTEIGLADAADAYPAQLSGGMARRAALARAFAIAPDLLLMDEPFLSLDAAAADRLRSLLLRLGLDTTRHRAFRHPRSRRGGRARRSRLGAITRAGASGGRNADCTRANGAARSVTRWRRCGLNSPGSGIMPSRPTRSTAPAPARLHSMSA